MLITQKLTPLLLCISFLNVYFSKVKRIVPILLLSLYISSFSGIMLNLHYCGGKLSLVRLFSKPNEKDCCGEVEMDDCCHDHSTWVKIETAHAHSSSIALATKITFNLVDHNLISYHIALLNLQDEYSQFSKREHLKLRPPLEIRALTTVFRI